MQRPHAPITRYFRRLSSDNKFSLQVVSYLGDYGEIHAARKSPSARRCVESSRNFARVCIAPKRLLPVYNNLIHFRRIAKLRPGGKVAIALRTV